MPWHERASVFLRAAELLAGPWRSTLNAATMLNQSKTSHQAEIDAVCEMCDFWRYNVDYLLRIYAEQPHSPTGIWNRMEYRPLEGSSFAVSPFNFACIGGNLRPRPRSWAARSCGSRRRPPPLSAVLLHAPPAGGGPAGRRHQPRLRLRLDDRETPRSRAPSWPGIHFTGSTEVFNGHVGDRRQERRAAATRLSRASSARPAARTSSSRTRPRKPRRSRPPSCAGRSSTRGRSAPRVTPLRPVEPLARGEGAARLRRRHDQDGRPGDFENFMGAVIDSKRLQDARGRDREAKAAGARSSRAAPRTTPRGTSCSRR
jgi:1-pyrroline-5-carboxylate dehydrogenase